MMRVFLNKIIEKRERILISFCFGFLASCGRSPESKAYFLSHHPLDKSARPLRHYPVARQGELTAWITSDHVKSSQSWLFAPNDNIPKYPIVGQIRAKDMPERTKHDGSFLVVSGYEGPLYDFWLGSEGEGQMFTGNGGWVPVVLWDDSKARTWVRSQNPIGGWSGFPVVIGDPSNPDAIVGAMWYRANQDHRIGGTTSSRLLKSWILKLDLEQFVTK
ncbi:hypothetical protein N8576_00690 [bacterium]|nr:hypothetical protein [bacterium]MDC0280080.1 hypothetical protein [Akkermansiaceae bacterium]